MYLYVYDLFMRQTSIKKHGGTYGWFQNLKMYQILGREIWKENDFGLMEKFEWTIF